MAAPPPSPLSLAKFAQASPAEHQRGDASQCHQEGRTETGLVVVPAMACRMAIRAIRVGLRRALGERAERRASKGARILANRCLAGRRARRNRLRRRGSHSGADRPSIDIVVGACRRCHARHQQEGRDATGHRAEAATMQR